MLPCGEAGLEVLRGRVAYVSYFLDTSSPDSYRDSMTGVEDHGFGLVIVIEYCKFCIHFLSDP